MEKSEEAGARACQPLSWAIESITSATGGIRLLIPLTLNMESVSGSIQDFSANEIVKASPFMSPSMQRSLIVTQTLLY